MQKSSTSTPATNPVCNQFPVFGTRQFLELGADLLDRGYSVRFRANGRSMHPTIKEGEAITIKAILPSDVKYGDILLYRCNSGAVAHRVMAMKQRRRDDPPVFILRGDASSVCDEPVEPEQILGRVVYVERNGRSINLHNTGAKILHMAWTYASRVRRRLRGKPVTATGNGLHKTFVRETCSARSISPHSRSGNEA